jgi:hypothetical protein
VLLLEPELELLELLLPRPEPAPHRGAVLPPLLLLLLLPASAALGLWAEQLLPPARMEGAKTKGSGSERAAK